MSLVNVTNITVANNVCPVTAPLVFQIEFECLEDLQHDVEWKVIYVTSDGTGYVTGEKEPIDVAHSRDGEIVLDAVCLGPVCRGILEFEFRVSPPDFSRVGENIVHINASQLNPAGILGMQAVLVTANYCDQEFIRIGYYTNNCYDDPQLRECPPDEPNIDKMVRCIIDQPRVTRFPIKWDSDTVIDPEGNDISQVIDDNPEENNSDEDEDADEEVEINKEEVETKAKAEAADGDAGEPENVAPQSADVSNDSEAKENQQTDSSGDVDVSTSSEVSAGVEKDSAEADMTAHEDELRAHATTESSRSDSGSDDIEDSCTSCDAYDESDGYDLAEVNRRPNFDGTADGEADNEAESNESSEDTDSDAITRPIEQVETAPEGSSAEASARSKVESGLPADGMSVKRALFEVLPEGSNDDAKVRRGSPLLAVSTATSITDVQ
ncbi:anti-silencing ASF1 family protein [Babesia ovata]|uniref:Anti-silencing ASF1 family protein n=1 Tax=Babesia ovata TaxID=189622 RepID=A0A2H6KA16_9APIC|nr:anti-silencing ASF1 family protein [Babesia ovata]GBE59844.1 anti-silencing ASF1 family protein [Babesia ovata]